MIGTPHFIPAIAPSVRLLPRLIASEKMPAKGTLTGIVFAADEGPGAEPGRAPGTTRASDAAPARLPGGKGRGKRKIEAEGKKRKSV